MTDHPPIPPSREQRLHDLRRRHLPIVVWLFATVVVAAMLYGRVRSHEFIGLAQVMQYRLSAPVGGMLDSVLVKEFDTVAAGDVIARLDEAALDARIQTALAESRKLTAELEAGRAGLESGIGTLTEGYASSLRRFRMDEAQRELNAMTLRVQVESDQIEAKRLELEASRAQRLFEAEVMSEADRDVARLAHERVRQRVEQNHELLARSEEEQRESTRRRQEFERGREGRRGSEPALAPLEESVKVQLARLEELRIEQKSLTLRAPITGEVSQILCRKGQAIRPGEPVVVISDTVASDIVAYLPEAAAGRLKEDGVVSLARRADPARVVESVVTRVGGAIEATPQQLWRDPRVPEYGLPVVIAATPALGLAPGEVVFVRAGGSR